ncbi:MAG: DUF177 domain-containing protein [Bacteroidota bacterium]
MASLSAFDIDIVQPSELLVYELNTDFWKLFEDSLVEKGKLTAIVSINRSAGSFQLLFNIQGDVTLVCDRSLEVFDYPIQVEKKVDFKWGHENKELDVDSYMIEAHLSTLNIAQHLYDFVNLAIPMKKVHPHYRVMND